MEEKKLFLTEEKTLNDVLNYLSTRPYVEVAKLIAGIQQSTPYVSVEKENKKSETKTKKQD